MIIFVCVIVAFCVNSFVGEQMLGVFVDNKQKSFVFAYFKKAKKVRQTKKCVKLVEAQCLLGLLMWTSALSSPRENSLVGKTRVSLSSVFVLTSATKEKKIKTK